MYLPKSFNRDTSHKTKFMFADFFRCANGHYIANTVCDAEDDCGDYSDEISMNQAAFDDITAALVKHFEQFDEQVQ